MKQAPLHNHLRNMIKAKLCSRIAPGVLFLRPKLRVNTRRFGAARICLGLLAPDSSEAVATIASNTFNTIQINHGYNTLCSWWWIWFLAFLVLQIDALANAIFTKTSLSSSSSRFCETFDQFWFRTSLAEVFIRHLKQTKKIMLRLQQ